MEKNTPTKVFLRVNSTEYRVPKLYINVDVTALKGGKLAEWEPVSINFLGQEKKVITQENGMIQGIELEFQYVQGGIREKLRVWGEGTNVEVTEYEILLPGVEKAIQKTREEAQEAIEEAEELRRKNTKLERKNMESQTIENSKKTAAKISEMEYELMQAREKLAQKEQQLQNAKGKVEKIANKEAKQEKVLRGIDKEKRIEELCEQIREKQQAHDKCIADIRSLKRDLEREEGRLESLEEEYGSTYRSQQRIWEKSDSARAETVQKESEYEKDKKAWFRDSGLSGVFLRAARKREDQLDRRVESINAECRRAKEKKDGQEGKVSNLRCSIQSKESKAKRIKEHDIPNLGKQKQEVEQEWQEEWRKLQQVQAKHEKARNELTEMQKAHREAWIDVATLEKLLKRER